MGGRSGQKTGGGGGGNTFAYSASDADVPIGEISAINNDYSWLKINGIDEQKTENWQKFVNSYTRNGYSVNKNIVDGSLNANDIKYIKGLNASLDKIPSTEGTFERGMRVTSGSRTEKLVNLLLNNKGKNITMTTFLSTTSDKTTAKNFSGTTAGTPALFTVKGKNGKSVEKLSGYGSEKEFVFKAGTKFKVNSAVKVFDAAYGKEVFKISLTEKP
jgi:hypothetical protein